MLQAALYRFQHLCSVLVFGLLLFTYGCAAQKKKGGQGITGTVLWRSGNFMPSPDAKASNAKGTPIVREILIYELTALSKAEPAEQAGFYQKINTKLIKKVTSNSSGRFTVSLPKGYYSLFVKEDKGLYANLFDDTMNIHPVHIQQGQWKKTDIIVDYAAVY
ncbi:hypothetical protein [Runella slithyformis]|uniref:Carboxypeptidase regulatory-like domain-containing protein n=1 Tax=Runella slithyformis (strain ATCC 29530 / DSM 19594 / LMG 11500 / NCIMB 11436 / LSU 4) TaxID=761193 RepID=A0A7U4E470_RUNSL|nr:hypothetical protein [Runella slithyformis]AEI46843.1 hypothetical protein Runsl_0391 [Runella slithyformis DSM 19594]